MKRIKILSSCTINKIAAGEIIHKPSSVLKELIENSCDACSSNIDIFLEGGGMWSIKVIDNGTGILKDDLCLSIKKHYTNKISFFDDLKCNYFYGFRGEALSSISSVSKMEISSIASNKRHGWKIFYDVKIGKFNVIPSSIIIGTSVVVMDLFYNLIVRKKMLSSEYIELNFLCKTFKYFVLSNFNISFKYFVNSILKFNFNKCFNKKDMEYRINKVFGFNMTKKSFYIDFNKNNVYLWGWLGFPSIFRKQPDLQYFFVNKRYIKSKILLNVMKQVCLDFFKPGNYPCYCLYLEIDAKYININVHPFKSKIEFLDSFFIFQFLLDSLSSVFKNNLLLEKTILKTQKYENDFEKYFIKRKKDFFKNILNVQFLNSNEKLFLIDIFKNKVLILRKNYLLILVNIFDLSKYIFKRIFFYKVNFNKKIKFILFKTPISLNCKNMNFKYLDFLKSVGFKFNFIGNDIFFLRNFPALFFKYNLFIKDIFENSLNIKLTDCEHDFLKLFFNYVDIAFEKKMKNINFSFHDGNLILKNDSIIEFDYFFYNYGYKIFCLNNI